MLGVGEPEEDARNRSGYGAEDSLSPSKGSNMFLIAVKWPQKHEEKYLTEVREQSPRKDVNSR